MKRTIKTKTIWARIEVNEEFADVDPVRLALNEFPVELPNYRLFDDLSSAIEATQKTHIMTKLTQQEFDEIVTEFLATQNNDPGLKDERYGTNYTLGKQVMDELRTHLFGKELFTDAERKEYLRLKAKYEMS